jgi:NADH:ubiquinone oxidoreductase subunit E
MPGGRIMTKLVKVEVCACTRCSMVGSMEIAQDILLLQSEVDEEDNLRYNIELVNISRPELTKDDGEAPLVIVNGKEIFKAESAAIMEEVIRQSQQE